MLQVAVPFHVALQLFAPAEWCVSPCKSRVQTFLWTGRANWSVTLPTNDSLKATDTCVGPPLPSSFVTVYADRYNPMKVSVRKFTEHLMSRMGLLVAAPKWSYCFQSFVKVALPKKKDRMMLKQVLSNFGRVQVWDFQNGTIIRTLKTKDFKWDFPPRPQSVHESVGIPSHIGPLIIPTLSSDTSFTKSIVPQSCAGGGWYTISDCFCKGINVSGSLGRWFTWHVWGTKSIDLWLGVGTHSKLNFGLWIHDHE